jgi:transposase InsO family protein
MANKIQQKPVIKSKKLTKTQLAKDMGISRGMLYYQHKQPQIDEEIKNQIEAILSTKGKESYGHKRIAFELKLNKKRILRVMKIFNIKPYKRRFKKPFKKDDVNKPATKYANLIKNLCPIAPSIVWVSDFTFIRYQYRFIYLSTIEDMYTREVLGFNISRFHNSELIAGAFKDALVYTKNKVSVYLHSDQGSEYDSQSYTNLIENMGIQISMSKKASPWENGYQESFYSQFKLDLGDTNRFNQLGELIEEIEHIIYRHNNVKTHSVLKTNPVNYRKAWESKVLSFSED